MGLEHTAATLRALLSTNGAIRARAPRAQWQQFRNSSSSSSALAVVLAAAIAAAAKRPVAAMRIEPAQNHKIAEVSTSSRVGTVTDAALEGQLAATVAGALTSGSSPGTGTRIAVSLAIICS